MPAPAPATMTRAAANGQVHAAAAAQAQTAADPDASGVIQDVFLTPRVLDRRAFEDYAESLKALIRDASGESHTLSRTAADVRVLREQLASAAADAQKRLDAAMKAIAAVEQRTAEFRPGEAGTPGLYTAPAAQPASASPARKAASKTKTTDTTAAPPAGDSITPDLLRALESRLEARLAARLEKEIEARVAARIEALAEARLHALVEQAVANATRGLDQSPAAPAIDLAAIERASTAAATGAAERIAADTASHIATRAASSEVNRLAGEALAHALEERLPHITERAAAALTQSLSDRAAALERSIDAAGRRATTEASEQGARVGSEAKAAIDTARAECEAAVRQITTGASLRVRKAQQDADAALDAMDAKAAARLGAARELFDQMLESLTAESQERGQWIKAALADLTGPRIDHLRSLLEQAAAQTDGSAESSLASAVHRAESLRAGVETNLVQIEELSKQVSLMRDLLARSILEGVGRIDDLDARQEELLASASRAVEQYAGEIDALRASMTVQALEAVAGGTSAADPGSAATLATPDAAFAIDIGAATADLAAVEDRLGALRRQTDEATQAAEWLTTLIDRAAQAGIAIDQSLSK